MVAAYTLSESNHHENTRLYLQSLMSGQKPDIRPEFGAWEPVVKLAEEAFASAKPAKQGETVQKLLTSLKRMPKKYRGLKELLEEKPVPARMPTQQEGEESESLMPALPEGARIDPRKALGACQWLDDFVMYSKQVSPEGYEDFHEGVGLWALSTVVAGRATIYHGERGIGTSLNIALCADTTMTAKTETANVGVDVLEAADLGWLLGPDETTPQKMLSDMAGTCQIADTYDSLPKAEQDAFLQRIAFSGQRGWFYDEFGALLRSMGRQNGPMADFKGLLLKVDGGMKSYTYATKISGTARIKNPRLSLLACMTPPDLKASMKNGAEDLSNGFLPRFALISPPADLMIDAPFDLKRKPVPFHVSQPLKHLHERLGQPTVDLVDEYNDKKDTTKITGRHAEVGDLPITEMDVTEEVKKAWQTYRSALKQLVVPPAMRDFRGFYGRYPTLALRIATLFAILEGTTTIQMRHWAKAQEITERWRESLHELYRQVNDKDPGYLRKAEDEILECIEKLSAVGTPPTARELSRRLKKLSTGQIRTVLIDLKQSGDILEQKSESGRTVHYVLADG